MDDGALFAGELLQQLHTSRMAMSKYSKQIEDLKTEMAELKKKYDSGIADVIKEEIKNAIPTIVSEVVEKTVTLRQLSKTFSDVVKQRMKNSLGKRQKLLN